MHERAQQTLWSHESLKLIIPFVRLYNNKQKSFHSVLDQGIGSLNLESGTASAAMNPLNTSLTMPTTVESTSTMNPTSHPAPAPVPLFQTPPLVPTLVGETPKSSTPSAVPLYNTTPIMSASTPPQVYPATSAPGVQPPYTVSPYTTAPQSAGTPDVKHSLPTASSTVTATPSQLLTDITVGATPAPLIPVTSAVNGDEAAVLQPTSSPHILAS